MLSASYPPPMWPDYYLWHALVNHPLLTHRPVPAPLNVRRLVLNDTRKALVSNIAWCQHPPAYMLCVACARKSPTANVRRLALTGTTSAQGVSYPRSTEMPW